eukprot:CAMPEP_0184871048 /NCGR_PEP_ID=MMETSP0580-20130426/39697_1 /TAXON_ID=1118495 /ORGANISM="Dactyliosolen fragilissimus" /LENGTH=518 /DNA_ID=CAMNT_0027373491 /DNA_START=114 /DNA_END=1670 /DNA_ORIENTATION=+
MTRIAKSFTGPAKYHRLISKSPYVYTTCAQKIPVSDTSLNEDIALSESRVRSSFVDEVIEWLQNEGISFDEWTERIKEDENILNSHGMGRIFGISRHLDRNDNTLEKPIALHLLPTPYIPPPTSVQFPSSCSLFLAVDPSLNARLTNNTPHPFSTILHLHQDVWENKSDIVKNRLRAKVGIFHPSYKLYARKTKVRRIDSITAQTFLQLHHLWGATNAKFNYGLYINITKPSMTKSKKKNKCDEQINEEEELVAVATFSSRRHVNRGGSRPHRSHELIRYCSRCDGNVVGGISKLMSKFCEEHAPDDIVTCIDRDWGEGNAWKSIGFEKVAVMPPLVMVLDCNSSRYSNDYRENDNNDDAETISKTKHGTLRRYLVGAGLEHHGASHGRPSVTPKVLKDLNSSQDVTDSTICLLKYGLVPVYDAGVERRMMLTNGSKFDIKCLSKRKLIGISSMEMTVEINNQSLECSNNANETSALVLSAWKESKPTFPNHYYSNNSGINLLLDHVQQRLQESSHKK